jgi:hypothetical protein
MQSTLRRNKLVRSTLKILYGFLIEILVKVRLSLWTSTVLCFVIPQTNP